MQGFASVPSVSSVTTLDVAVVGGGAIGAACARALALRGVNVGIFEPGARDGAASPASAGMLAAQIEAGDEAWLALAAAARDRYPALAAELAAATGMSIGLRRDGIAAVAFDAARAAELAALARRQQAAGLRAEWLAPAECAQRWRGAAPGSHGALFAPDDGAVSPPQLTAALTAHAIQLGAQHIAEPVVELIHDGRRINAVTTSRNRVAARHVVIAAGAWSPAIGGLPRALPVAPLRGQLALVPWPAGTPDVILYHDHGYVLRRGEHALLGSTMEHAGFDARVTPDGQAAILAAARRLIPALSATVTRSWAGLRPMTPDGLPLLGPDPEIDGLWYATGHGRNGILLAALTGDVIADLITTGTTAVDIGVFRADRFSLSPRP